MQPKLWMCVISPAGNLARLQNDFEQRFIAEGAPNNASMFCGQGPATNIVSYFSPEAVSIFLAAIVSAGGEACVAPDERGITVVAGHLDRKNTSYLPC